RAGRPLPAQEVIEQRRAALALDDATEVQEVRTVDPEARAEARAVAVGRDVHADAHHVIGDAFVGEGAMYELALFFGVERDRAGGCTFANARCSRSRKSRVRPDSTGKRWTATPSTASMPAV